MTDIPINVSAKQSPADESEWAVSFDMCHTPRRVYVTNLTELNTKTLTNPTHVYVERRTCEMEYVSDWMSWHCKACDMMDMAPRNPKPRFCKWCGAEVTK